MSGENIRTFLIMSHGSWPEKRINADSKGRQFAPLQHPLYINAKGFNSTTPGLFSGNYKNIDDTKYIIPNKTRLFTTTNYGILAIQCPKYDTFIKTQIGRHGINIFTSPEVRNSLPQKYEFIKNSRLYTDGNKIVNIDISFESEPDAWNIWEKVDHELKPVQDIDLKKEYKLSEIISKLTLPPLKDGIAVPNQRTQIILHCCMPKIDLWTWGDNERKKLENKINLMMRRGTLQIQNLIRTNKFKERKTKGRVTKGRLTRSQHIILNNQTRINKSRSIYRLDPRVIHLRHGYKLSKKKKKKTKTSRMKRITDGMKRITAGKRRTTTAGKRRTTTAGKRRTTTA